MWHLSGVVSAPAFLRGLSSSCRALIPSSLVGFVSSDAVAQVQPRPGVSSAFPALLEHGVMWDGLNFIQHRHCSAAFSFPNPKGNVIPVRAWGSTDGMGSVGIPCGAQDAQGVGAPGWEFCSPLLSFNSRPVEIRDQQNKSSCSSSLSLAFSQAVFFSWEGPPVHCAAVGTGCGISVCVMGLIPPC